MSHRAVLLAIFATLGAFLGGLVLTMLLIVRGQAEITAAEERHGEALALADLVRQTSDDLTRMARTYVVTGDPVYEQYFLDILAIRRGELSRPRDYGNVYWDFYIESGVKPTADGPPVALEVLLEQADLTDRERAKLLQAEENSDTLARLESEAMGALEGRYRDAAGGFTVSGEPDPARARELLHGVEYHAAKAEVMRPLKELSQLLEARQRLEQDLLRSRLRLYAVAALVLIGAGVLFVLFAHRVLRGRFADAGVAPIAGPLAGTRRKILGYSIATTAGVALVVGTAAIFSLYATAIRQEARSLGQLVQAQARLIEAVARFDRIHSQDAAEGGASAATIGQVVDAQRNFSGLGRTGEIVLARREDDSVHFILERRHRSEASKHLSLSATELAEPMRRALSGESGAMRGRDYRGELVLAAYEPVVELGLGLVAKIDIAEVRAPFVNAALLCLVIALVFVCGGGLLTVRINNPLILEVERREEKYRRLVEALRNDYAFFSLDPAGAITYVSPSVEGVLGYSADEFLAQGWRPLLVESALNERAEERMAEVLAGGLVPPFELELRRRDDEVRTIEVLETPVLDEAGQLLSVEGIARDITERKRAASELEETRDAAETANRAKSAFLANMSHELRTPMNAILGYSEMLIEEAEDLEQQGFIPDLQKIHAAGGHLLELINGVLDLSKVEAGKMELFLEEFETSAMVREVAATVEPLVQKNANRLEVVEGPELGMMRADLTKLRQTLFNLLSNAAKFTDRGTITLTARREREVAADWILFEVADSGIGIPTDKLQRVFEEFAQADVSTTREFGGTGLGLAISRRFCQMMGGDITAQSREGAGSTFTVRLPAVVRDENAETAQPVTPDAPEPARAPVQAAVTPGSTVLVVDDDPAARELIERTLRAEGVEVRTAVDGEEGLRLARELRPAAITLDVMMPGLDGWAVLRALKADPSLRDTPVVMVSITRDRRMGYSLGATEFLTKPVDREQLVSLLRQYRSEDGPGRVLVVEDDEEIRELFRRTLGQEGWEVDEAQNGRIGLERMEARLPSLIILDLMMPEMDGFEFVARVRQQEAWREIPIFVVTAMDLTAEDRSRLNGYVEQILAKSAHSSEELLGQVRDLVRARLSNS